MELFAKGLTVNDAAIRDRETYNNSEEMLQGQDPTSPVAFLALTPLVDRMRSVQPERIQ